MHSVVVKELVVVGVEVVVYVTEECIFDILAVVVVLVGVERDSDVVTSAGCIMGGECRSSGAGEEDVDEPEEIRIGSWLLLTVVGGTTE